MLTPEYWQSRYETQDTSWDVGIITPPLQTYIDQLTDKSFKILIAGAGNAHEAEYLWKNGFRNVFIADIAPAPLQNFQQRCPDFPKEQLLHTDFFAIQQQFDRLIEQTFFCAINPELRAKYAQKSHELLVPNGKLVGLLFNHDFGKPTPPFGGNPAEYEQYFNPYFDFLHWATCYNSIQPRKDREWFMVLQKKS
ncbi:MAG: SAM-dependent methyltransferase [Thermoflexibacteraceae bacterium]|jgi:hypothetical protein